MSDQTPQEVGIAERIARKAHADQRDLDGQPYIDHVARVVSMVDGDEAKAVAWLHDVLEDSPVTPEDLDAHGISLRVINAVRRLTRTAPYEYAPYIDSLRAGQIAARVKVADLRDHLTPNCPDRLRPRYEAAIALLLLDDPVATLTARCEALEKLRDRLLVDVRTETALWLASEKRCEALEQEKDAIQPERYRNNEALAEVIRRDATTIAELRVRCEALTAERDRLKDALKRENKEICEATVEAARWQSRYHEAMNEVARLKAARGERELR